MIAADGGKGYGRIVNIASVAGKEGNAGMGAYSASKGAVSTRQGQGQGKGQGQGHHHHHADTAACRPLGCLADCGATHHREALLLQVIALTKVIGKEYAETGITCNALAPAVIRTAMVDAMPEEQVK